MKKFTKAVALSALMLGGLTVTTPAHADIDDWLRRTFSGPDHVGDWLRDTFGPVQNPGNENTGNVDPTLTGFREAQIAVAKWEQPRRRNVAPQRMALKSAQSISQICPDEVLVNVIKETGDMDMAQRICFKSQTLAPRVLERSAVKTMPMKRQ